MQIRKILYPTDFSESSLAAMPFAVDMAKMYRSKLVIVHVHEPELVYGDGLALAYANLPQDVQENAEKMLEQVSPQDETVEYERHMILEGPPGKAIARFAEDDSEIDLIVIATHGRSGISRLLMGSVAENVVRHAPCPVLSYKAKPATDAGEQ